MKKFITLLSILISASVFAQHTPLKHIEVGDYPSCKVKTELRKNITETTETYSASFALYSNIVSHEKGIKYPALEDNIWGIKTNLDSKQDVTIRIKTKMNDGWGQSKIYVAIGECNYLVSSWYYSADYKHLYLDLNKSQIEHMSISGFQGIYLNEVKEENLIVSYSDVCQELWRRCAKEVYDKRKHL